MVLANPPYSIKQWNREAWSSDPWGRNSLGTPPQGRADYAFFQHILASLTASGPLRHPLPARRPVPQGGGGDAREAGRADLVECVLGLGPNLFYNSPMEACVVVCRTQEAAAAQGQDAVHRRGERGRPRAGAELPEPEHQQRILAAYETFADEPGFAKVATLDEIGGHELA